MDKIVSTMWACWAHGDLYGFPVFIRKDESGKNPHGYNEYGSFPCEPIEDYGFDHSPRDVYGYDL